MHKLFFGIRWETFWRRIYTTSITQSLRKPRQSRRSIEIRVFRRNAEGIVSKWRRNQYLWHQSHFSYSTHWGWLRSEAYYRNWKNWFCIPNWKQTLLWIWSCKWMLWSFCPWEFPQQQRRRSVHDSVWNIWTYTGYHFRWYGEATIFHRNYITKLYCDGSHLWCRHTPYWKLIPFYKVCWKEHYRRTKARTNYPEI